MRRAALLLALALAASAGAAGEATPPQAETPLTPALVLASVTRDLQARLNLTGDLELDYASAWNPPAMTARSWKVEVIEFPESASASMFVRLRVYADSAPAGDFSIVFHASLWADAWFAREPLATGTGLDSTLIEARRVDCLRSREAVPASNSDPNLVLTHPVQAGAMVAWSDLGRKPLVLKGDIVDVTATSGLLRITMKGLALQNGAAGDIVTIRNPESLKTIPARVVAEGRVEVRL